MKEFLHAKLHNVKITQTQKEYEGSITIDKKWLILSGIRPYEKVLVADVENGARFETYVIEGEENSGIIAVNGSAANLVEEGHRVIIMAFEHLGNKELPYYSVIKLIFDENNKVKERIIETPWDNIIDVEKF